MSDVMQRIREKARQARQSLMGFLFGGKLPGYLTDKVEGPESIPKDTTFPPYVEPARSRHQHHTRRRQRALSCKGRATPGRAPCSCQSKLRYPVWCQFHRAYVLNGKLDRVATPRKGKSLRTF